MDLRLPESPAARAERLALLAWPLRDLTGDRREAARLVFSWLSHVEQVAVLAAQRGAGVCGQLDDEIAHREAFYIVARDYLGGVTPIGRETRALLNHLERRNDEASKVALNHICERWLEATIRRIGRAGIAPEMFEAIADDELRHCSEAAADAVPDGRYAAEIADVETLLVDLLESPSFGVPLVHLIGTRAVAETALANVRSHRQGCRSLGVTPGPQIRDIETAARAALLAERESPDPVEPTAWEVSKAAQWSGPAPMTSLERLPVDWFDDVGPVWLEAEAVRRLSLALAAHPELNRTIDGQGRIWAPRSARVGIRRQHSPGLISTVYVDDAHRRSARHVADELRRKVARLRRRPYRPAPDVSAVRRLLPPPRCAATLTNVGQFGITRGVAPFAPDEGATISVTVGGREGDSVWVGIAQDHRAADGRELGLLCRAFSGGLGYTGGPGRP